MNIITRWLTNSLFLAATLFLGTVCPAPAHAGDTTPAPTILSNALGEFTDIITSPVHGTWEGYFVTAGFAAALAAGFNNDLNWYHDVQDHSNDWQDQVIPPASLLGDGFFHVVAYAALYKLGNDYDQQVATRALEGQLNVAIIATLMKAAFTATRPETNNQERLWFTGNFSNKSFASGHTMTAFCAAAILGDAYNIEWITFPLAALVGYARIYNQHHWPSDVIAGAGLGLLIGYSVTAFHQRQTTESDVSFSLMPTREGGQLKVSWHF
ncbi:phosphatase PAP2 family protein [bacterium]|nr:phosphatase PAP2 family protein [bacterium]